MTKKVKFYGSTFLTKRRKFTEIAEVAEKSIYKYGYDKKIGKYFTSYLGMINGWLGKVGLVLEAAISKPDGILLSIKLKKIKNRGEK